MSRGERGAGGGRGRGGKGEMSEKANVLRNLMASRGAGGWERAGVAGKMGFTGRGDGVEWEGRCIGCNSRAGGTRVGRWRCGRRC